MQQPATDVGQQLGGFADQAQVGADMGQQMGNIAQGVGNPFGQQMGNMAQPQDMSGMQTLDLRYPAGTNFKDQIGQIFGQGYNPQGPQQPIQQMPSQYQGPQMPQPSANNGGRYRLSPGVYGTREQAMQQYNDQMNQAYMPYVGNRLPAVKAR
jgi:hypothetical protein